MVALLVLSLVFLFLLTQLPVLEWGGFATKPVDLFSDIRVDEQDLDLPGDAEWQEEGTEWLNEGVDSLSSVEKDEPQDRQVVPDTIRVQETADTLLVTNISSDTAEVGNLPRRDGDVVLFEDFSPGKNGLSHLLSSLKSLIGTSRAFGIFGRFVYRGRYIHARRAKFVAIPVWWEWCGIRVYAFRFSRISSVGHTVGRRLGSA